MASATAGTVISFLEKGFLYIGNIANCSTMSWVARPFFGGGFKLDEFVKFQLEHARKLRLHQDLLRFAIPAAYFTFIGATIKSLTTEQLTAMAWVAFIVIGFVVYIATISEHYYYVVFENWERHLEALALNPSYNPMLSNPITASDGTPTESIKVIDVLIFENAKEVNDMKHPDLAHPTMLAVLLGIALTIAAFTNQLLAKPLPAYSYIRLSLCTLVIAILLSIYQHYHTFYEKVVQWALDGLKTK